MSSDDSSAADASVISRLKVSDTNAVQAHGNSVIKPGDKVEYEGRMCRVIEVFPERSELKLYHTAAFHSSIETVHAEEVTGYESRE